MEEVHGSDLQEPRNGGDVHAGSRIRFLFLTEYNHLSNAHDLCGSHSTWLCPFWLGLSSSETAILKTSHATPRIELKTLRLSEGGGGGGVHC